MLDSRRDGRDDARGRVGGKGVDECRRRGRGDEGGWDEREREGEESGRLHGAVLCACTDVTSVVRVGTRDRQRLDGRGGGSTASALPEGCMRWSVDDGRSRGAVKEREGA